MKGRRPDPNRARRGTGHTPVRSERDLAPVASLPAAPEPPDGLSEEAAAIWRRVVAECDPRLLRSGGDMLVAELCRAYAFAREASEHVARVGMIVRSGKGPVVNPMFRVWRDSTSQAIRLAEQVGLTPAAHVRLGLQVLTGASLASQLEADLGPRR